MLKQATFLTEITEIQKKKKKKKKKRAKQKFLNKYSATKIAHLYFK